MSGNNRNAEVIDLGAARRRRRLRYLRDTEGLLGQFLRDFVQHNFKIDFAVIHDLYRKEKLAQNEQAWDFHDLREVISDAIRSVYGGLLWQEVCKQRWFKPAMIDRDELIERCTSQFILSNAESPDSSRLL